MARYGDGIAASAGQSDPARISHYKKKPFSYCNDQEDRWKTVQHLQKLAVLRIKARQSESHVTESHRLRADHPKSAEVNPGTEAIPVIAGQGQAVRVHHSIVIYSSPGKLSLVLLLYI